MTQSISGLGSGLDTAAIVQQLVALERRSIDLVTARKTRAETKLAAFQTIRESLAELRGAASAVKTAASWRLLSATSSNTDVATVSTGTGTFGGTISFVVDALASAGSVRSAFTLSGTSAATAADDAVMIAAGGARIGFAAFQSDNALALGSHEITVTQSSAAATKNGDTPLAASTLIDGTNDTLNISVNGSGAVLTLAHGTYTRDQLATAVQAAADTAGAAITVTVDSSSNELQITSNREGSAATLQVTGGTALTPLMLSTDGVALTGTDGKVQIGDEPEQTVSSIDAGGTMVLNAIAGTVTATFAGGLREGEVTVKNVDVGDGSLASVVSAINSAGAGVTASAVQVGSGIYRLQITSNTAGALNGANVADAEFGAGVGGFVQLTAASDAQLTVGDGPGAYTVTSETNTVSGLLPGVTVTLKSTSDDPVTVTANRDVGALAANIEALVEAANAAKQTIAELTEFDSENNRASILTGDAAARRIISDLSRAITDAVPWANPGAPGLAGLSINRDGEFEFDAALFTTKFNEDPEGVTAMFVQGGSATTSELEFVSAGDRTRAGTYAVEITQAATRASNTGLEGAWPIGSPPTIRVRVGSTVVEYEVGATDTQADVVEALNTRFSLEDLALSASIDGTGIAIESNAYGSSAQFEVAWDGSTYTSHAGLDVVGTINGETATGRGQLLSMPFDHSTLGGLTLRVTASTIGAVGDFTYQSGVGQRIVTGLVDATDVVTGYLTSAEKALRSRVDFIEDQVESMNRRITLFEARLRRQFAALDATLGVLQSQSNWLAGQVGSLTQQ